MKLILKLTILLLLISCNEKSLTTRTHSSVFKSHKEKVEFLNKYVRKKSDYLNVEYNIIYHDNSTGMLTGPNDWDIKLKATVDSKDISSWIIGCPKIATPTLNWSTIIVHTDDYQWYSNTKLITIGVHKEKNEVIYHYKTHL